MRRSNEEKRLLTKLESGILDGMVGDEKVYHGYKDVYCGKYIKNGEPVSYREGEATRFFTCVPLTSATRFLRSERFFSRSVAAPSE